MKIKFPNRIEEWQEILQDTAIDGEKKIEFVESFINENQDDTGLIVDTISKFINFIEWSLADEKNMFRTLFAKRSFLDLEMREVDFRPIDIYPYMKIDRSKANRKNLTPFEKEKISEEIRLKKYKKIYNKWSVFKEYDCFNRPLEYLKGRLEFYKPNSKIDNVQIKWELVASDFCYLMLKLDELGWITMPPKETDALTALQKVFLIQGPDKIEKLKSGMEKKIPKRANFGHLKNEFNLVNNTSSPAFKRELSFLNKIGKIVENKNIEKAKKRSKIQ